MFNIDTAIDGSILQGMIFEFGAVLLALFWFACRRSQLGSRLLSRYIWVETAINFVMIPLMILGIGRISTRVFEVFGKFDFAEWSSMATQLALFVTVTIGLGRIAEVWICVTHAEDEDDYDGHLPQLLRLILYGVCLMGAVALFLTINGYRPTELYLSTGMLAAVLAFAMQQTLGDFFAGLTMSLESPFKLGDWIVLEDGTEGGVIDINWRTTRLRQWDNATLVVPNSILAKNRIRNLHGKHHKYSPWYMIRISADYDPRAIKVLLLEAALRCKRSVPGALPTIRLSDASQSPYSYMVWVHFPNYQSMFVGREELFREIHDGLHEAGIQVAVDMQEVRYSRAANAQLEPPSVLMALKSLDFAAFITEDDLNSIATMSTRSFYEAGAVILDEEERADCIHVISTGVVEVSVSSSKNNRHFVEELNPGKYFGLAAMLTDEPAVMQYTARTDVSIVKIDIECLRKVAAGQAGITEQFAELVHRRRLRADEAKTFVQVETQAVTLQDLVRRVDRAFRKGPL